MAIWQFYLEAIPREGIEKIHPEIPEKINVSIEDVLFEADTKQYWELLELYPGKTIQKIDMIIQRASWGNDVDHFNWKTSPETPDNDAFLALDFDSRSITHFHFRSDLREKNLKFLRDMIELCREMDWLLMDRKGILVEPMMENVIERVKVSNTLHFLSDPEEFFEDLNNGKIQIE